MILVALLIPMAAAGAGVAEAQVPTLPRVDSLIAAGDYDAARSSLERWWSAREEFDVPGSDRARAFMLRARLAPDMEVAEPDYLSVVLGYPTSEHAPEALLRLGQGLIATGEAARAAGYLQRLVTDYPGVPQHTPGLLWLARAQTAARSPGAACAAAREGLRDASDPDLVAMLRVEQGAACAVGADQQQVAQGAVEAAPPPAEEQPPVRPRESDPPPGAGAAQEDPQGGYAAQAGAFRYNAGATDLVERLERAGFRPRTVLVPANSLLRVRVGRFASAAEAARLVARLKAEGFDAYVVGDVRQEQEP